MKLEQVLRSLHKMAQQTQAAAEQQSPADQPKKTIGK
jgi:hypothetical protein